MPVVTPELINTVATVLPSILALVRGSHPAGAPAPTDEDIIEALNHTVITSLVKDDAWRAAHPPGGQR